MSATTGSLFFHFHSSGHENALSSFTLKKLILLVCFLDKAKESRLIEHDPCLFCMDAEFKVCGFIYIYILYKKNFTIYFILYYILIYLYFISKYTYVLILYIIL